MNLIGLTESCSVAQGDGDSSLKLNAAPGYLDSTQGSIYCWHHLATGSQQQNLTLVICAPMGYEYTHSHRSLKFLADTAAQSGFPVFRFDFHGSGDSPGDELANNKIALWLTEIQAVVKQAKRSYPDNKVCLLGLRFGATLAYMATASSPVDELVVWEPVVKGRRYIRELVAVSKLSATASDENQPYIESAGFLMSADTAKAIQHIDLLQQLPSVTGKVYCLYRDDVAGDSALLESLHDAGFFAERGESPGFAEMMAEPQDTVLPEQSVNTIVRWLQSRSSTTIGTAINSSTPAPSVDISSTLTPSIVFNSGKEHCTNIKESVCWYSPRKRLFGVLCCPTGGSVSDKPLVILANSGSVHHVGPNRVYVHLARQLAACGVSSLRIDIQGIGESCKLDDHNKNHPYQDTAVSDVTSAVQYVLSERLASAVTIAGICSGSYSAFHSALAQNSKKLPITEIILINPLTFYWQDDMSLDIPSVYQNIKDSKHYAKSIRSLQSWKKLVSGKASVSYIINFIGNRVAALFQQTTAAITESISDKKSELACDLLTIMDKGIKIIFVFASTDPGLDIVNAEAKRTFRRGLLSGAIELSVIDGADHTFSKIARRDDLYQFFSNKYQNGASQP